MILRYFGWESSIRRYGPYTQDPKVIRLTEQVRDAFATRQSPAGAFCFFRPEQKALGQLIMKRIEGAFGLEFDSISLFEFKDSLRSAPLSDMESVQQTLEALGTATSVRGLPGCARLARVQNHLVDLLSYIEDREGFSLFIGERRKATEPRPT